MRRLKALSKYIIKIESRDFQVMFFSVAFPVIMYIVFNAIMGSTNSFFGDIPVHQLLIPSYLPIILMNSCCMTFGLILVNYKERGFFNKYRLLGFKNIEIVASISVSVIIIALFGISILILAAYLINGTTLPWSHAPQVITTVTIMILFQFSLAYFVSTIAKGIRSYNAIILVVLYFQMFFGGFTYPPEMFPQTMRSIMEIINPMIHGLYALRGYWIYGNGLMTYAKELGILLLFIAIMVIAGNILSKKSYKNIA